MYNVIKRVDRLGVGKSARCLSSLLVSLLLDKAQGGVMTVVRYKVPSLYTEAHVCVH